MTRLYEPDPLYCALCDAQLAVTYHVLVLVPAVGASLTVQDTAAGARSRNLGRMCDGCADALVALARRINVANDLTEAARNAPVRSVSVRGPDRTGCFDHYAADMPDQDKG